MTAISFPAAIWAGLPLSWREDDTLDLASLEKNIGRMLEAGVHGIYLLGSTGEFYALDEKEFRQVVDCLVSTCPAVRFPSRSTAGRPPLALLSDSSSMSPAAAAKPPSSPCRTGWT